MCLRWDLEDKSSVALLSTACFIKNLQILPFEKISTQKKEKNVFGDRDIIYFVKLRLQSLYRDPTKQKSKEQSFLKTLLKSKMLAPKLTLLLAKRLADIGSDKLTEFSSS